MDRKSHWPILVVDFGIGPFFGISPIILDEVFGMNIPLWILWLLEAIAIILIIGPLIWIFRGWLRDKYRIIYTKIRLCLTAMYILIIKHKIPHFASYNAATSRIVKDRAQVKMEELERRVEHLEKPKRKRRNPK